MSRPADYYGLAIGSYAAPVAPSPATRSTRPVPSVGMEVGIVHLGVTTPAVVEQVLDGGRTVVAGGVTFELSQLTAHFVRAGDPYFGVRLALSGAG
jgi:hypothetical protein